MKQKALVTFMSNFTIHGTFGDVQQVIAVKVSCEKISNRKMEHYKASLVNKAIEEGVNGKNQQLEKSLRP